MAVLLPITVKGAQFVFKTELESVAYTFDFRWNWRDAGWYFNLLDGEGVLLVAGVRVVLNTALLKSFRRMVGVPSGVLVAVDSGGQQLEAGQDDLGSRVKVYYLTEADLA
jgi:hypothetical protein